jgi:hypothetical protein
VDTRRTPGAVLHYHAIDQFAQRLRCRCPTGLTERTRLQSDQNRRRITQNTRSWAARRGCGWLAAKAASC